MALLLDLGLLRAASQRRCSAECRWRLSASAAEVAAKLGEEAIRDLLLVNLNAQFEGDAAGELFNGEGKTHILIRVEDRNIFIGECKIRTSPAAA